MPNANGNGQMANGQGRRVGDFNAATRQSLQTLTSLVPSTQGQAGVISRVELPQSSYFSGLWAIGSATVTAAAASTATAKPYPVLPSSMIRRYRIFNNQGVEFWNTSGYGAYGYMRSCLYGFDPAVKHLDAQMVSIANAQSRYWVTPTNLAATESQEIRWAQWFPVTFGPGLSHGLQLLQDPAITYTLETTWGDLTDIYSATTGTVTFTNQQIRLFIEEYSVPDAAEDQPRLAYSKTVLEDITQLLTGTGENPYRFVTGNIATRILHELSNTSAGTEATRAAIPYANITNLALRYAQTQTPYNIAVDPFLFRMRALQGADLPQGWINWDLSNPLMIPQLPGTRDALNTARLTDLFTFITLSGVTLNLGQLRTIREQLVANRR